MKYKHFILFTLFFYCSITISWGGSQHDPVKSYKGNGMMFTPNMGQITDANKNLRPDILYKGNGNGTDVYIRKTGISYVESDIGEEMNEINEDIDDNMGKDGKYVSKMQAMSEKMHDTTEKIKIHRIDMDFVNASANNNIIANDRVEGYNNYYLWNCPEGITHIYSYNELTVENIYPNIDVIYRGDKELGLKYNIMVYPGGDPSRIVMRYSGSDNIHVVNNQLMIETSLGIITERLPEVYQIINGKRVDIEVSYKLENTFDNSTMVSYRLTSYNPDYILIIDPWITYYGGSGVEAGYSIAADSDGNIVFTGSTYSPDFPVSTGAFQTSFISGMTLAYLVKMDADDHRIFGTYLGGSFYDIGMSIVCDETNNIYVAGETQSSDFPVGASFGNIVHQSNIGIDIDDAFLAKFDTSGIRLWATYYGGEGSEGINGICIDRNSNTPIICGFTMSYNSIVTAGSFQTVNQGQLEAFVAKFSANGTRQWGTYIGGGDIDAASNICCDSAGNIFICGTTEGAFPVIAGHQMTLGGNSDAFISKLNPPGTNLIWSSYYGGATEEAGLGIACDRDNNVILGGMTRSTDAIATSGSYQNNIHGEMDGFLVKFNNNGVRQWGTYLGGSDYDQGIGAIACDANNNIVTGGDTYSHDYPITSCAYQKVFTGSEDQFISTFRPDGSLLCSGYLGLGDEFSPNNETMQTQCIAVYGCYVYLYAYTNCNYPVTPGAYQTFCSGHDWQDAVAKLYYNTCGGLENNMDITAFSDTCMFTPINFSSSFVSCDNSDVSYKWIFQGGTPSTSTEANPTGIMYSEPGDFNVILIVNQTCGADTLVKTAYIHINPCSTVKLDVPNVFTPNGDGYNDTYKVKYSGEFTAYNIQILNRWGVKMYESDNIDEGWSCNKCADGTYYYVIEAKGIDGKKFDLHGTITLIK